MQSSRFSFLFAALSAASLAGCMPPGVQSPPPPTEDLVREVLSVPSAHALRAYGTLRLSSPEGNFVASAVVFYSHPESLKVVVQGGFGTTVAEIALAGDRGVAYLPQQRQAFELREGSGLLLGTAVVYPSMLFHLLKPVDVERPGPDAVVGTEANSYVLASRTATGTRIWRISGRSRRLESEEYRAVENTTYWNRSFGLVNGTRVPKSFSVRLGDTSMSGEFTRIDLAPANRPGAFSVVLPPGVEPMPVPDE